MDIRLTGPTRAVLEALLAAPEADHYGFSLGAAAGLASGTVHPILARLEARGWVSSRWEELDPREAGRPARRYYRLTADGLRAARTALARRTRSSALRAGLGAASGAVEATS